MAHNINTTSGHTITDTRLHWTWTSVTHKQSATLFLISIKVINKVEKLDTAYFNHKFIKRIYSLMHWLAAMFWVSNHANWIYAIVFYQLHPTCKLLLSLALKQLFFFYLKIHKNGLPSHKNMPHITATLSSTPLAWLDLQYPYVHNGGDAEETKKDIVGRDEKEERSAERA